MFFRRNDYSELISEVVPMSDSNRQQKIRSEQTLEVEVKKTDTISSIALSQNCKPSDIKVFTVPP